MAAVRKNSATFLHHKTSSFNAFDLSGSYLEVLTILHARRVYVFPPRPPYIPFSADRKMSSLKGVKIPRSVKFKFLNGYPKLQMSRHDGNATLN